MQEHAKVAITMIDLDWEGMFEKVESMRKDVMRVVTSSGRSEKVKDGGGDNDAETSSSSISRIFLGEVVNDVPLILLYPRLSVSD